jgi:threonine/homoserine/homoserine lactone efflux protein
MGDAILPLLSIAGAIALGAMSPGPSFVMVARTAVARSRRDGLAAALGMGVGGVLFVTAVILGVHVVLSAVPWLYAALKLLGGIYLAWLGWRIWRGAREPLRIDLRAHGAGGRTFLLGLATQLSNPKTAIFYASVVVSLLPPQIPGAAYVLLPLLVFAIEAGWYSVVALALSADSPRAAYLRWKAAVDRTAGAVMVLLGGKLILDAGNGSGGG